jgi:hypothetical protein
MATEHLCLYLLLLLLLLLLLPRRRLLLSHYQAWSLGAVVALPDATMLD